MERTIKLRQALKEAMVEEMRRDSTVFLMGEEVAEYNGAYKVSEGMLAEFGPMRVIDTPITELGFTGVGVGAAMNGLRPVVEFMTWNFAVLAFDQIVNNAAKTLAQSSGQFKCPIVFRGPSGSAGQLAQQHSQTFESWLGNCPGLKVISCIDPYEAKGLLKAAIRDDDPVCVMESEVFYGMDLNCNTTTGERTYRVSNDFFKGTVRAGGFIPAEGEDFVVPIGKAVIRREGADITLVTYNKMVFTCLQAADVLEQEGIHAEVIDLRTIRPLDIRTVMDSVKKTNRVVVVDESWPMFGVSSEVAYQVQKYGFDYLDAPVTRVNSADTSTPYAKPLVEAFVPSVARIVKAVKEVMYVNA